MLGNPNAQRIPLKKTFCSKMLKINLEDDFEQKVFLSGMRCALGFPNIKSSMSKPKITWAHCNQNSFPEFFYPYENFLERFHHVFTTI